MSSESFDLYRRNGTPIYVFIPQHATDNFTCIVHPGEVIIRAKNQFVHLVLAKVGTLVPICLMSQHIISPRNKNYLSNHYFIKYGIFEATKTVILRGNPIGTITYYYENNNLTFIYQ